MPRRPFHPFLTAIALSLGAAIALGISRFSYTLLLPPMRSDLGWTYFLAGSMSTGNALGYFLGALVTPGLMRRFGTYAILLAGAILTGIFMLLSGFLVDAGILLLQRLLAGIASALLFIAGGVFVARLAALHAESAGFLIGIYYGGTGFGIVLSALFVPSTLALAAAQGAEHAWQAAWLILGVFSLLGALPLAKTARHIDMPPATAAAKQKLDLRSFFYVLASYFMFGVGYIGYMTFIIALLKEQGMQDVVITMFYTILGIAVIASSRIWARMLDRFKRGESFVILNGLLAIATILPAFHTSPVAAFFSGLLFGAVFLSVVASTTVFVRHNLPPEAWPSGISAFTIVFALGQIIGPILIGWIADGAGGLQRGLIFSSIALGAGALLGGRQKALKPL